MVLEKCQLYNCPTNPNDNNYLVYKNPSTLVNSLNQPQQQHQEQYLRKLSTNHPQQQHQLHPSHLSHHNSMDYNQYQHPPHLQHNHPTSSSYSSVSLTPAIINNYSTYNSNVSSNVLPLQSQLQQQTTTITATPTIHPTLTSTEISEHRDLHPTSVSSGTAESVTSMGSDAGATGYDMNNSQENYSTTSPNGTNSKKRRKPAPTIATGRRNLKCENVSPEEAERRDKRRERNRKSAQRCRERKIEKKESLQLEINSVNRMCQTYLDVAERVINAWKHRLRILDDKLPGHTYESHHMSLDEFENIVEDLCQMRNVSSSGGDGGDGREGGEGGGCGGSSNKDTMSEVDSTTGGGGLGVNGTVVPLTSLLPLQAMSESRSQQLPTSHHHMAQNMSCNDSVMCTTSPLLQYPPGPPPLQPQHHHSLDVNSSNNSHNNNNNNNNQIYYHNNNNTLHQFNYNNNNNFYSTIGGYI